MGLLKVVISFVAIGLMGWQMQRDHPDTWTDEDMWRFEIPAAILAAGWIARDGWCSRAIRRLVIAEKWTSVLSFARRADLG